jgi:hypothetical protein
MRSSWINEVALKQMMCPNKKTEDTTGEEKTSEVFLHVKMEAEIGVMSLQSMESQGLLATTRS